jgi:hypothetical protein
MFESFTKGITISRKSKKKDKTMAKIKLTMEQTMIFSPNLTTIGGEIMRP